MEKARRSLAVGFALAVVLGAGSASAFSEVVEFDALVQPPPPAAPWSPSLNGWRLTRVRVFELTNGARAAEPFYTEEIGYARYADGVVHVTLGATDHDAFRAAFHLDKAPDDSEFSKPLVLSIEACGRVRKGNANTKDTCDGDAWQQQGRDVNLNAAPLAMSVAQVPLFALPPEVVLQNELDAAIEAERRSQEAALAAVRASIAAEQARALQAEGALRGDFTAADQALRVALDAEAASRQASEAALANQLAAEQASRAAEIARLETLVAEEATARQVSDQQVLNQANAGADARVSGLRQSLATPGGAAVHYANLIGTPSLGRIETISVYNNVHAQDSCFLGIGTGDFKSVAVKCPDGYALTGCSGNALEDATVRGNFIYLEQNCSAPGHGLCCATHGVGHCLGGIIEVQALCARVAL